MKYLGFGLLVFGAVFCYGAKMIVNNLNKNNDEERDTDKEIAGIKLTGFVIALIGAVIIFAIK